MARQQDQEVTPNSKCPRGASNTRGRDHQEGEFPIVKKTLAKSKDTAEFPDHVKAITTPRTNKSRVAALIEVIGAVAVASFRLEHAQHAMRTLPAGLKLSTRRHYAQVIRKVLAFCVYPLKHIDANPVPVGFMPKGERGAGCPVAVPQERSVAVRGHEGAVPLPRALGVPVPRSAGDHGARREPRRRVITHDKNKTNDPRAWVLAADVRDAPRVWLEMRGNPDGLLFVDERGRSLQNDHVAEVSREHLEQARVGEQQPALFVTKLDQRPQRSPFERDDRALQAAVADLLGSQSEGPPVSIVPYISALGAIRRTSGSKPRASAKD